jgi:DNA polymerase-3 subunit beta
MEIRCSKEELFAGVQAVERIVATRSTLPIVGNILFETEKNGIKISANNLEMGLEISIPAGVKGEGAILIPAKTLGGIVAKLPNEEISIKATEKGAVRLSYKKSNISINSLPAEEFPALPKLKDAKSISIQPKTFIEMVKHTAFAVSQSDDKYVLNGVLIETGKSGQEKDESNFRMVATDGYRLAKIGQKIPGTLAVSSVIIPAKALAEVSRMLQGSEDGSLQMNISNEQASFVYKDVYLVSRMIQGQFPDYKQVIPKSSEAKFIVDKKALLEAAERAAVIASGSSNIIKFVMKDGSLHLVANAPDVGSADESVEIESSSSINYGIAFNVRLITDVLKIIDTEKISLEFSGTLSPGIIRPVDGPDYTYIIMPIRTTDTAA